MAKVYVFMPARNEEENLPKCLENLLGQTLRPQKILVINDASTDGTQRVCDQFGVSVVNLTEQHENYVTTPGLAYKLAKVINHAFPPPLSCEYMMQHSPDMTIPPDYIEGLTTLMKRDPRLVIASGRIEGEYSRENHPRGAGRICKTWFWTKHIKKLPLSYTYETYPLLKAQSLGLKVQCVYDYVMTTSRPTRQYKANYGYAMRELGYLLPYVLGKCVLGLPKAKTKVLRLLYSYLTSPYKLEDPGLKRFMKYYQAKQFMNLRALVNLLK